MSHSAASPAFDAPGEVPARAETSAPGKIGPNAILQVQGVLVDALGEAQMHTIMHEAGLGHYLRQAPRNMVDEREVVRLHQAVRTALPECAAIAILTRAGEQTAAYILANRIPRPVQAVLKRLPASLASTILLRAIARNAWTFTGSGSFAFQVGKPTRITLTRCPACDQVYRRDEACAYYTATIQGLFAALVHPRARVREILPASADGSVRTLQLNWS